MAVAFLGVPDKKNRQPPYKLRLKQQLALLFALWLVLPGTEAAEWRAVEDQDLSIQAGSALDFSGLVEAGPAGKHGRIIASADGHMRFAGQPDKNQRFLCASQPYGVEEGFPDHDTADRYARQLRLHGYNLARFHFVDNVLMSGRSKDFDFDPEQLDRFHYFMAALKREGIYWMLDALTSWNGAYGDVGPDRWADKRNVKMGVYLDPEDQAHWRQLVNRLLAAENPYTGLSPLQDPALAAVILVNEGGLNSLLNHQPSPALNRQFAKWLAREYGSVDKASKKWGRAQGADMPVLLPHREWHASSRMADAQRFYFELQASTLQWMTAHLRSHGYQGFISSYDNWFTLQDIATRSRLDLVATHAYFDEPGSWVDAGSTIKQVSSLPDNLPYVRELASGRYWNKPFAVTEYDQPFWNRYRFESGLAIGAYAGLQDWDLICRHASGPIQLAYGSRPSSRHQYLYPYGIGLDPVARAAETLAALLFLRRDVKPAQHRVMINLSPDYVFDKQGGIGFLPADMTQIGLLTGLGVSWNRPGKPAAKNDLVIDPVEGSSTTVDKIVRKVSNLFSNDPGNRWQERVGQLRKAGILRASNQTDAESGILQSDTGQIVLNTRDNSLHVSTDRTEAFAFNATLPTPSPRLAIKEFSDPALLSASSMDGAALDKSARILLIFASDARNSGMEFADKQEKVLRKLGSSPVLIKSSRIRFQLKHVQSEKMRLYALKLNGERAAELPFKRSANGLDIVLNTADLRDGPTTYFELAR